jgi:hypothetical protein
MVNNSEKIKTLLSFEDKDDFYFVQILKRRKDNPGQDRDVKVINNYYIESLEQYDKLLPHIINLCDVENARAYFRINKRNYAKLGQHMLLRVAAITFTENCKALKGTFDSIASEHHCDPDKKWIVDVDIKDFKDEACMRHELDFNGNEVCASCGIVKGTLISTLQALQLVTKRDPMLEILPTPNGVHIITRPFNLEVFREHYPKVDVHKDNPTILYCPSLFGK